MTERSKITSKVGDGPPMFVPFSEATSKKQQHFAKPTEQTKGSSNSATLPPQKDVKIFPKQTDKPKGHQHHADKAYEAASYRQTGNKPHQHHHTMAHHRDRFQDRPFQGQPSKQRTHNPQYKRSKGHVNDRSQEQSLSDFLPVTFNSSEEHFPALSHSTHHPQPRLTAAEGDTRHQPPHKPILAWDSQTSNTNTGGSIPFSAKRKT